MMTKMYNRWFAGAALGLALATSLAGASSVSAQTVSADLSAVSMSAAPLTADGSTTVVAGTLLTVHGTSFEADEYVGLWINVPDGVEIPSRSLGQDNSGVVDGAVGLNEMGSADENGDFTYTVDTSGLPEGTYTLVAHGLASGTEQILSFTVTAAPSPQLSASGHTTVAAGTVLSIQGTSFEADEPVGMWINVPDGVAIPADSLGQVNTYVDGSVISLNEMGWADSDGNLVYSLDTSGLPAGDYSLVAHGLKSGVEEVLMFTIR